MTHENTLLLTIGSTSNFRVPSTYCKALKIIPGYCTILPFPSSSLKRSGSCCTWKNPTGTRLLHSPTDQNWACSWSKRASREDEQINWNSRQRVKQYSCSLAVQRAVAFFLILSNHFSSVISCQQLHGKCHRVYLWGSDSQREGLVAKVSEHMDISWVTTDSENLYRAERVERQLGQLYQDFCWVIVLHPGGIIITVRPVLYIILNKYTKL